MMKEDFPGKRPAVIGIYNGFVPTLFINDPEMVNDLYVSKNKYFDKEEQSRNVFFPLMGDTILFAPSTEEWSLRRKAVSATFYKEKLVKLSQVVIDAADEKVKELRLKFAKT